MREVRRLDRIREAILLEPLAILPEKLSAILAVLDAATEKGFDPEAAAGDMQSKKPELLVVDGVPVIPIEGTLFKKANLITRFSGGTSVEVLDRQLTEALAMPGDAIVLKLDTPGGAVDGIPEFASRVRAAAMESPKRIIAIADTMAASAGYWIGSQANAFYATEASVVGSIGVIATIYDQTRAMKNEGVDPYVIRSSELKAAGAGPMTPNQEASIRKRVDRLFGMFQAAVSRGRPGIDIAAVSTGETWIGPDAVAVGLIDGISTFDRVIAGLAKKSN